MNALAGRGAYLAELAVSLPHRALHKGFARPASVNSRAQRSLNRSDELSAVSGRCHRRVAQVKAKELPAAHHYRCKTTDAN